MASVSETLTRIAYQWGARCFGEDHMLNRRIRALRCAEEAVELAQCLGVDRDQMHLLVSTVYGRPRGEPVQELGGVLLTASILCVSYRLTPDEVFETEVTRCLAKDPAAFAKRNEDKINLGLR